MALTPREVPRAADSVAPTKLRALRPRCGAEDSLFLRVRRRSLFRPAFRVSPGFGIRTQCLPLEVVSGSAVEGVSHGEGSMGVLGCLQALRVSVPWLHISPTPPTGDGSEKSGGAWTPPGQCGSECGHARETCFGGGIAPAARADSDLA